MDTKIQELTDKIYKEGVEKGNEEAGRIIADANAQKQAILTEAEAEAKRIVAQAEKQAAELKKNTEAELKLFATQSVEALKSDKEKLNIAKITFTSGVNAGSAEFETKNNIERCPLCGITLNKEGVCPKCGYKKK